MDAQAHNSAPILIIGLALLSCALLSGFSAAPLRLRSPVALSSALNLARAGALFWQLTVQVCFHARQVGVVLGVPPVGGDVDRLLLQRDDRVFVAAGVRDTSEECVRVDLELVQGEGGVQPFDKKEIQDLAKFLKEKDILPEKIIYFLNEK